MPPPPIMLHFLCTGSHKHTPSHPDSSKLPCRNPVLYPPSPFQSRKIVPKLASQAATPPLSLATGQTFQTSQKAKKMKLSYSKTLNQAKTLWGNYTLLVILKFSPVSATKPAEKKPRSSNKKITATRVFKISRTPSSSRTPLTVNNIDDMEKETRSGRGHISSESVSKVINACISISEKKWS
eukprot:TRINITY_DN6431_c0_g1_i2.p2 TRINITY_DN6431_c0_g1~~TRINITY_DN6431_c0_g1_i2.p2  ORF type:complete len:182 (-),score=10.51 TRINITY_DN6431_c0_g1_i2:106-651(-)